PGPFAGGAGRAGGVSPPSQRSAGGSGGSPPGLAWRDLLTGVVHPGPRVLLAALTQRLPVALLVPAGSPGPAAETGHDESQVPG
ncbi:MAG: hypothetical protein ACHP9Z_26920, partial [Streptosporangiales bacterium]